jgi:hypothetical protein
MILQQFVRLPFMAQAINSKTGTTAAQAAANLSEEIMRTIVFLALAAGAMLFAAPASALPPVGGAAQGYSDYLDQSIVEVKGGRHHGHRQHARGGHHHRHFAFRIHRRHHHARGWYDPCRYGYVLRYGRCVPYFVR